MGMFQQLEKVVADLLVSNSLRGIAKWHLQTTFLIFLDIFCPLNFRCFGENGVFQQPRLITPVDPVYCRFAW